MLYPEGHPYHWPVIGYMEDLTAASYDDVVAFFKTLLRAVERQPGDRRRHRPGGDAARSSRSGSATSRPGAPVAADRRFPACALTGVQKKTITDRVQLPRLYLAWLTPPQFAPGDAALDVVADVLAGGKNSRLYKRLVYDMQIAQNVSAYQGSQALSSSFLIEVTPRPGHTVEEMQKVDRRGDRAGCSRKPPTDREVQRALNQIEASFYSRMERVGGFGGKADQLNGYFAATGNPDWFNEDLARYRALSPVGRPRRRGGVPPGRPARRADRRAGRPA